MFFRGALLKMDSSLAEKIASVTHIVDIDLS